MLEFTTENFSGPLGLLLELTEREEMDITEVNLAKIADEYVAHIKAAVNIDPEEMADFLLIASKLLFAKSKALLPYLYADSEDDELDDLERQLKMYKEFILASQKIKEAILLKRFMFVPPLIKSRRSQIKLPAFTEPSNLSIDILRAEFIKLITNLEKRIEPKLPEERLEPKINIEERISLIRQMLLQKIKISFSRFLETAKSKTEVVVSFLAILELAKQHELVFEQEELFSEIHIKCNP